MHSFLNDTHEWNVNRLFGKFVFTYVSSRVEHEEVYVAGTNSGYGQVCKGIDD